MEIKIAGKTWRKDFCADIIKRLGILTHITKNNEADLFIICDNKDIENEEILDYAKNGASAIFLYPDPDVIKIFGNELMYTYHFPLIQLNINLPITFLQVFPSISLIRQKQGESIAYFAFDFSRSGENYTTKYPAVIWKEIGRGKIGIFMYDFIATVLLLLQGWEFFTSKGEMTHTFRGDISRATHLADNLINPQLNEVPQAYFHELLLLFLMRKMVESVDPLIRLWYFPYPYKNCFLLSGDTDELEKRYLEKAWNMVLEMGAGYTQYTMVDDIKNFSSEEIRDREKMGIEFGLHYYAGQCPSREEMLKHMSDARKTLLTKGITTNLCRGHSCIWVGWDEQVEIMEKTDFLYSSNLLYWDPGVSYGFPYYLYSEKGKSRVQELQIFTSDDTSLFNKSGRMPLKPEVYLRKIIGWLDINKNVYHQPLNPIFHPFYLVNQPSTISVLKESLLYAKSNNIPFMNHSVFLKWWEKRKNIKVGYSIKNSSIEFSDTKVNEAAVALPISWNKKKPIEKGEITGTGEMIFPLKDNRKITYEKEGEK